MNEVTHILKAVEQGDPDAAEGLLPLVYEELRQLASQRLTNEPAGQTLQATALVHEAYLRLVDVEDPQQWNSRGHFFAAAAEAMRRILVENARRKRSVKHGGQFVRQELQEDAVAASSNRHDLLAVHETLDRLENVDAQAANLVKLRYFAGLTVSESANALGLSTRTAERLWTWSKAWIYNEIQKKQPGETDSI
ncbi:MAG: sigma-70 family RNA polymerase sigma factor [Fuerstiella sp.]|nr:sigma-70 family RNA polymerase sigma factor [Fuerstiella sp.]